MNKPVKDPKVSAPEQQTAAPEDSVPPPSELVLDDPPVSSDPPMELAGDDPLNPETSSPVKMADTNDDDVVITDTGYREPGRPIVLAKHSAKEEHIERRKVRFDVACWERSNFKKIPTHTQDHDDA